MKGRIPSNCTLYFNTYVVMAQTLPEGLFQITDGPSKFDLMNSLFSGKIVKITCDILPTVPGGIKISPKLDVQFVRIGIEDGSFESWIGKLRFAGAEDEIRSFYYSSKNRKGTVREKSMV